MLLKCYWYKFGDLKKVIYKLINFFLSHERTDEGFLSSFPNYLSLSKEDDTIESRIGWCYGDLGIGYILLLASKTLDDDYLYQRALKILLKASRRRVSNDTFIIDAGFCHGSIGTAHIYNRIYQTTKMQEFKEASFYFYNEALQYSVHLDGFAGYKAWKSDKFGGPEGSMALLQGISGIGLSLISAVSGIEPKWDKFFCLS